VRDRSGVSEQRSSGPNGQGRDLHELEEEQRWLARYADELRRAAEDQTTSDSEQTESDADQSRSDLDRELSHRDQLASERDQRASDRDQSASDQDLKRHPDTASREAHDVGRAGRQAGSLERDMTSQVRALNAEERALQALGRDESARRRDRTAEARDSAAERRDQQSAQLEQSVASRGWTMHAALEIAAQTRTRAAEDRARAAEDRAQAAVDRERAALERTESLTELRRAHLDALTGALRRGAGEMAIQGEIDRARREDGRLVLAFVDVDSLRDLNNREGHAAGDALLQDVASAIQGDMRSYEPVVRYGGDEFVCAMSSVDVGQAERRFAAIRESITADHSGEAISIGLAELRPDDSLSDLVGRADTALLAARREAPVRD
jgi:diguanylate cyclase (GGDEF)-like protein